VRLTDADISALAGFLGLPESEFIERHTRLAKDRRALSLIETPGTTRCEFLEGDSRCLVYPARPAQCRDFLRSWRVPGCPALSPDD
jgi:Fe-S-cluster containining protein